MYRDEFQFVLQRQFADLWQALHRKFARNVQSFLFHPSPSPQNDNNQPKNVIERHW